HHFIKVLSFVLSGNRFFKVFEIRDFWPQIFIDMGAMSPRSKIAKIFFKVERYLISKSDMFVSNLSGAERYCKEKGIVYNCFYWVPNGVREKYRAESIEPAILEGQPCKAKIMYTGAHGKAQNLYEVMKAAKCLLRDDQVEFHFLGDGTEKYPLQSYVDENNIGNVYFYNPVNTEDVKKFILAADVLLLPLVDAKIFSYGISPNKLPEYLASGKPIIFFGPQSASPFVDGVEAIVSSGTDSIDLVAAVKRYLLMSESETKKIKEESNRLMESKFLLDQSMGGLVREMLSQINAR
ncbi:MAG: glycosyltransferase family 4 protein, partial [Spirochaetales bacterium]|nr:glycosyltransferase family 4 protein [Spirochaetales bacterium]